ncbi:MAG: mechanosensitive ion channel [Planctomycetaceae bacterium]
MRHRRLAIEQARSRRAVMVETPHGSAGVAARVIDATESMADLSHSTTQSQRLVGTTFAVIAAAAVWLVWADVLPALNYFNTAEVWSTYQSVTTEQPALDGEAGASAARTTIEVYSVTLADLLKAMLVVVLTITAARNLPGMLEIAILEKLPFDPSVRYAVQAISRYVIVVIGIIVVSHLLGLNWSSVQWLAAALTFGLGFGLQEIFANFISGLIILFERPVRVGDVVTIDNVSWQPSAVFGCGPPRSWTGTARSTSSQTRSSSRAAPQLDALRTR